MRVQAFWDPRYTAFTIRDIRTKRILSREGSFRLTENPKFVVKERPRNRMLRTGKNVVHAWMEGTFVQANRQGMAPRRELLSSLTRVIYDINLINRPFYHSVRTQRRVDAAEYILCYGGKIYAKSPRITRPTLSRRYGWGNIDQDPPNEDVLNSESPDRAAFRAQSERFDQLLSRIIPGRRISDGAVTRAVEEMGGAGSLPTVEDGTRLAAPVIRTLTTRGIDNPGQPTVWGVDIPGRVESGMTIECDYDGLVEDLSELDSPEEF